MTLSAKMPSGGTSCAALPWCIGLVPFRPQRACSSLMFISVLPPQELPSQELKGSTQSLNGISICMCIAIKILPYQSSLPETCSM